MKNSRKILMRNLIGTVRGSFGRIFMRFQEDTVDTGGHGGTGKHRGQMAVACGVSATSARTLDRMGGIENGWESLFADPVERAHVGDEVIISEGGTALGEAEIRTARRL